MTGVTAGNNDCLSYNNDIYYSIGNLTVDSTKGKVFAGTRWYDLVKFLAKNGVSATMSMTRSEVVSAISSSLTPGYILGIELTRCYCTHAACLCEADADGTHATEKACEDDTTNCCS
jgi:hypothetical protein